MACQCGKAWCIVTAEHVHLGQYHVPIVQMVVDAIQFGRKLLCIPVARCTHNPYSKFPIDPDVHRRKAQHGPGKRVIHLTVKLVALQPAVRFVPQFTDDIRFRIDRPAAPPKLAPEFIIVDPLGTSRRQPSMPCSSQYVPTFQR